MDGTKPRVLIADDQQALRALMSRLLAREGFEPIEAADGVQAVELFRAHNPVVVVSDVMMPRMDGLSLLTQLKQIDRGAVVILMTGQGNEDMLLRALRGGATNFFRKPFNVKDLMQEIRKVADFRLEAARATLFTPFLVAEEKHFILPRAGSAYFPVVNQVTMQLPAILPDADVLNLRIGIEEMIVNAVEHGNLGITFEEKLKAISDGTLPDLLAARGRRADAAGRVVRVSSALSPDGLTVTVGDDGEGFDWRSLPALAPENLMAYNGRGIFLTKIYFDEVLYNDGGTEVTLRKHARHPAGRGGKLR